MDIDAEMKLLADPARAEGEKKYLKSDLTHLGVGLPAIRKVAVAAAEGLTRDETLALVGRLWAEPVHESRMAAIEILARNERLLNPGDLGFVEQMIRTSRTWAYVDPMAVKIVGGLLTRNPELATTLDGWVGDDNFWIRRTTLLALLPDIRASHGDLKRLRQRAEALIDEREFFVRKALGWVMRELTKVEPAWVRDWVAANIDRISGVTIREAVRHLPTDDKETLLAAYKSR
jgi:3-methyladenine DNA glycosylase AlkD